MLPLVLIACAGADPSPADTWTGFRNDGSSSTAARDLPVSWSPTENVAWRTPLPGYGQSSPVVWRDRVFVTAVEGPEKEKLCVVALDAKSGAVAWKKEFAATQKGKNNTGEEKYAERLDDQAWATPVAADAHVYFFGKSGVATVLKAGGEFEKVATNRLWSKDEYDARLAAAKKAAAGTLPKPPEGKGPGGGPPLPKDELEATRYSAVGDVVYGVAAVGGAFFVRTGTELVCVRHTKPNK